MTILLVCGAVLAYLIVEVELAIRKYRQIAQNERVRREKLIAELQRDHAQVAQPGRGASFRN